MRTRILPRRGERNLLLFPYIFLVVSVVYIVEYSGYPILRTENKMCSQKRKRTGHNDSSISTAPLGLGIWYFSYTGASPPAYMLSALWAYSCPRQRTGIGCQL